MNLPAPRSVRGRAILSTGIVVFLGTALMAAATVFVVHGTVMRALDESLRAAVNDVSADLAVDPPSSSDPLQLAPLDPSNPVVVQVLDEHGRVVASTPGVSPQPGICESAGTTAGYRVLTEPITSAGRQLTVCAARSSEDSQATWRTVALILALAVPVVTAVACLLVARRVGTALRSVGQLAHDASAIESFSDAHLPSPGTGDEIEQLARTLNDMLDRLHDQTRATRQFVADASHELRTPLTSLHIALELGRDTGGDPQWVDDALTDLDSLTSLVEDLLALARADSGAPQCPTRVLLPAAVGEDIAALGRWRPEVTIVARNHPVEAHLDPKGLQRIVRNLLSNAVRHAVSRVEITFCSDASGTVEIEVRDDGPGIPADQVEHVFERFVRLDHSRTRDTGGSGLGLPIVAAVTHQAGGTVRAFPGPGGRIVVAIPSRASATARR